MKLAETWPARTKWTLQQLTKDFGEVPFRISQRSPQKITMKLKDYVSYMELQHDEDPLYIFDDKVSCIHHFISFATKVTSIEKLIWQIIAVWRISTNVT